MAISSTQQLKVPYFRPSITEAEISEVAACLRSGWLTTGPRTRQFEQQFAETVGAKYTVAVNSGTAALHLAVEALGLRAGQAVLVPTMTFAATAEVVRYQNAVPILVDCDPVTLNMDLDDAERRLQAVKSDRHFPGAELQVVGMIPVHVGGLMLNVAAVKSFASRHGLWIVEDAAHALPAACRENARHPWRRCGDGTAAVTCFSFYSNKTITTGEGGMAATGNRRLAERMKQMSLHGLSGDAWGRYDGKWDYRILCPGFKYNLTDIAASIGIHQLRNAESMRRRREDLAYRYLRELADVDELDLPPAPPDRVHAWHVFAVRLRLRQLSVNRNAFLEAMRRRGVGSSVHWRPLHLHPYYQRTFDCKEEHFPTASAVWRRLVSLPLFPDMQEEQQSHVIQVLREMCQRYRARRKPRPPKRPR